MLVQLWPAAGCRRCRAPGRNTVRQLHMGWRRQLVDGSICVAAQDRLNVAQFAIFVDLVQIAIERAPGLRERLKVLVRKGKAEVKRQWIPELAQEQLLQRSI